MFSAWKNDINGIYTFSKVPHFTHSAQTLVTMSKLLQAE